MSPRPAPPVLVVPSATSARGYRAVLAAEGARAPVLATALTALPIGIVGLALILLVKTATGSPAAAGAAAAALGLGVAVGMLVQGRLLDTHGPRRVLPVVGGIQVLALVGLVVVVRESGASALPLVAAAAFVAGTAEPQVVGSARAAWSRTVEPGLRPTGVALTSLVFDACVALGPVLFAALLLVSGPSTAVLACAATFSVGALTFALSRASRGWRPAPTSEPRAAVPWRVLAPLACSVAVQGLLVGALQIAGVVTVAASDHAAATFALAALPLGSLAGTAVAGLRPPRRATGRARLLLLVAVPVLATGLLGGLAAAVVALFAAGTLLGPVAVGCHGAISRVVAPAAQVRAFTLVTGCGIVGMSTGAAAAGLAGSAGFSVFALAAAVALFGAVVVTAVSRRSGV